MIVDQAHRLHERVDGGGADEAPAALLEVAGEGLRVVITPDEVGEGLLLGELDRALGVVDRRLDLAAVADDAGVLEQALDVRTVRDLADNKYVLRAQNIVKLADEKRSR